MEAAVQTSMIGKKVKAQHLTQEIIECCDTIDAINDQIQLLASIDVDRVVERRRAVMAQDKLYDEVSQKLTSICQYLRDKIDEENP